MDTTLKGIRIHDGVRAGGNLIVQNQLTNGANTVSLDSGGNITFPTGASIVNGYPGPDGDVGGGQSWFVTSNIAGGVASSDGKQYVQVDNGGTIYIGTNYTANTGNTWMFSQNGIMSLPYSNYIQTINTNMTVGTQGGLTIISNAAGGATNHNWTFGQDGTTTFPGLITTTGNIITTGNLITAGGRIDSGYQYYSPSGNLSFTANTNVSRVILDPSSAISLYANITLPGGNVDAKIISISSTANVQFLSVMPSLGCTLAPFGNITLSAGTKAEYFFHAVESKWYKVG